MKLTKQASLSLAMSRGSQVWQALDIIGQQLSQLARSQLGKGHAPVAAPGLAPPCDITITEAITELLFARARAQRSDRYLRQLRVSLKSFAAGRFRAPLAEVTTQDIERWIQSKDWAPKTVAGYVTDVRTLYHWAIRRGYLDRNPAAGVELPAHDRREPPSIHTPDQVKTVLDTARRWNLDVCRVLAIRYFAGIRSAECHRLSESDLKLEQDLIEVPAVKAKTRARRLVTVQPNLRAWLALGGELRPMADDTIREAIRLSGVVWAHNVTRHSFVSYHLAQFQSAGKTALEAGHSEQMLFNHYRALVTPQAAAEFWGIKP